MIDNLAWDFWSLLSFSLATNLKGTIPRVKVTTAIDASTIAFGKYVVQVIIRN